MALPTRKAMIEQVSKYLDSDSTEGKTVEDVAKVIVDGTLDLLGSAIKKPVTFPHVGLAFAHPSLSGVWHVAYSLDEDVWIVSAGSKFGALVWTESDFWKYADERNAKAGAPGSNAKGYKAGEKLSRSQRQAVYRIAEVCDKGALLLPLSGAYSPLTESNDNLDLYYRREIEMTQEDNEW